MPASILAVGLGYFGSTEQVGGLGSLAVGPGGALMLGGGALVFTTTPGPLVLVSTIVDHPRSLLAEGHAPTRIGRATLATRVGHSFDRKQCSAFPQLLL